MSRSKMRRSAAPIALLSVIGLTLAACGDGPGSSGNNGTDDPPAEGTQTVTIYGTIVGHEAEALQESWAAWAEENDINIEYNGSQEFEEQIAIRAEGGNAPDLAIFPQPGLLVDLANRGHLKPAPEGVQNNARQYWSEDWVNYGSVDGVIYGAPLMASVKGFIWYPQATFAENGWEIPNTWQGLLDLTEQIYTETGNAPWCVGFGSDAATGWPGTDWIEDLVLRQHGPEVYDQWVANEIPFTDPLIQESFDAVGEIILNPNYVNAGLGDVSSIGTTPFGDPVAQVLVDGECYLHHQASFFDGFITAAGGTVAEDGDIWAFITPSIDGSGNAVTGGGEIVGAFSDRPAVAQVQEYLASAEWANSRVSLGGVISANTGLDPDNASSDILKQAVEILQDEDTLFRFDGSDLMPGAVGAGSFWQGMRDWVNGTPTEQVLRQIESGWPSE